MEQHGELWKKDPSAAMLTDGVVMVVLQFALPYEVGFYRKFRMGGSAHRPQGCPGLDVPVDQFPGKQGPNFFMATFIQ